MIKFRKLGELLLLNEKRHTYTYTYTKTSDANIKK